MAPKSPQVVSLSALTVRSGSALPSLHQNSQPISQGTYSASSFSRSNTRRAASMTSLPTPSPGIHAILYLAIGRRLYRRGRNPQAHHGAAISKSPFLSRRLGNRRSLKPAGDQIFGAASDDQFLSGGTERREG